MINSEAVESLLPKQLVGDKLILQCPPSPESDESIAALLSDHETMEHLSFMTKAEQGGWTIADARKRREYQEAAFLSNTGFNCAMYSKESNCFVGICGFRDISWWNRSAEMGVIVHKKHWKRGYCVEAHHLCLRLAFETLLLNRVEFRTAASNMAMIRFCQQLLGATHEGTLRDFFPVIDPLVSIGTEASEKQMFMNVEILSVLAKDWPVVKEKLLIKMNH